MLRRLAHPQTTRQFARSFNNLPLHRPRHQQWPNLHHRPAVLGVTRLPDQWRRRNVVGLRQAPWGGQVAGFHSTRRNEGLPLFPFFAAVLKVPLPHTGVFVGINLMFAGVQFHRARSNREQGSPITRPIALPQEPQIEKMAPEGLTRDGGETTSDFEEDSNEDNSVPPVDFYPRRPLLGNNRCKFGADAFNWAVRVYCVWYAHQNNSDNSPLLIGGGSSYYRPKRKIK